MNCSMSNLILYSLFSSRVGSLAERSRRWALFFVNIWPSTTVPTVLARDAFIVEEFPILACIIPKPLQWWRLYDERLDKLEATFWIRLWRMLEAKMVNGTALFCYVRRFMEQKYKAMGVSQLQGAYAARSMIEVRLRLARLHSDELGWVRYDVRGP